MKDIPTKKQWKKWTLPAKTSYKGYILAIVALLFAVIIFVINGKLGKATENRIIAEIHKIQPQDASEELKKEVRTAEERITNPITAEDFFLKGYAAQFDENYDKAIKHYQKAIELRPNAAAYNNMGNAHDKKGNYDKAIEYYDKAIEIKPDVAWVYYALGSTYYLKSISEPKYHTNAVENFQKATQLGYEKAQIWLKDNGLSWH